MGTVMVGNEKTILDWVTWEGCSEKMALDMR